MCLVVSVSEISTYIFDTFNTQEAGAPYSMSLLLTETSAH